MMRTMTKTRIHLDTRILHCPSCKVSVNVTENRSRHVCSYCGSYFDADVSRARSPRVSAKSIRSASPKLPSVANHNDNHGDDSAVGNLLMSSLTSLTLGSLGMGNSDKLPEVSRSSRGSLITQGSTTRRSSSTSRISTPKTIITDISRTNFKEFRAMMSKAKHEKKYEPLQEYFTETFNNPSSICNTFKKDLNQNGVNTDTPELRLDYVYYVFDCLKLLNVTVQKAMIRAVVSCLLDEATPISGVDNTRVLYILLQNPLFTSQSTYTILAHLLQQITRLSNREHQYLVRWLRSTPTPRIQSLIQVLLQFITIRQFPPADKSLPPLNRSRWWIPTATKVLALINAANNLKNPPLLPYTEFYNISLDHMDLMQEYYTWQNPERSNQFSYCQYPFILSIVAKQHILTKDSEQQMILTARRSLVQKMARHQHPQIEIFFLNISVRRDNLVEDSLKEISEKQRDLKKKLKISFFNEPGLDMGGLTKEWFQLLIKQIFDPEYGMFVYYPHSRCYWFSVSKKGNLREYNLIGVLMGLAVYNSIILDLHFPSICYRKLLTPPVVPALESVDVGVVPNPSLDDLSEIMPDVAQSLKETLEYKGDIAEDLMVSFQASVEEYGKVVTFDLKPGGKDELVTNETKDEFVSLYLNWLLNTNINERFRAFYLGFHSVCASNALIMLRPEEVEQLVCGSQVFELSELRKVTFYDGYKVEDATIQYFWEVLEDYSEELQKKFLLFTTGSDRVPVGGTADMTIKVSRIKDKLHHLPIAHTCFNQLVLPDYKDKDRLKRKLTIAISNAEGFGLE